MRWERRNCRLVVGKCEFGLHGVMAIEVLAGKMRLDRGGIAAGEDDMRQTYTLKHILDPFELCWLVQ